MIDSAKLHEIRLRGDVRPEDFTGSDTERIEQALALCARYSVGRVKLTGSYTVTRSLVLPQDIDFVLDHAVLTGPADAPVLVNQAYADSARNSWALQDDFVRVTALDGEIRGDVLLHNVSHLVLDGLRVFGTVRLEYVWEARLTDLTLTAPVGLVIGRSCNNFIVQRLETKGEIGVLLDSGASVGEAVIAKEPEIHEIILQDSRFDATAAGVQLVSDGKVQLFNLQMDHLSSTLDTIVVGRAGESVPEKLYFNLTGVELSSDRGETVRLNNGVKSAYWGD